MWGQVDWDLARISSGRARQLSCGRGSGRVPQETRRWRGDGGNGGDRTRRASAARDANAANGTDLDAADQHHSDLAVLTTTRSPQISGLMGVLWAHVFVLDPHLNREAAVHGQHLQAREEYSKDPPRLLTREHACRCSDWPLRLRRPVCRHARPSSEQARMRGRKTPWDHLTAIVGVSVGAVVCRRGT